MQALGTLPALVLPGLLARAPLTPDKVRFVWGLAVGPAIARATTVVLEGSRLVVHTSDRAWTRELERSAPLILGRMQHLLGAGIVEAIHVSH